MNLDQLFNKAKQQAPLMSMDDVRNMLQNPPPPKKASKSYGKFAIYTASLSAVLMLGILLLPKQKTTITLDSPLTEIPTQILVSDSQTIEKNIVEKTKIHQVINKPEVPEAEASIEVNATDNASTYNMSVPQKTAHWALPTIKTKEVVFNGKDSSSRFRLFGDSIHFQHDIKAPHIELRQAQYAYVNDEENIQIRYLDLDIIDLKKLGVTLNEKGMFYNNDAPQIGKLQLFFEEMLDLRKHSGKQQYMPTYSAALDEEIPSVTRNVAQSNLGFYPYLTTDTKGSQILSYMFDKTKEKPGFYALQGENVFEDASLKDKLNQLIPVRVRLKEHEILLWFTLNSSFLNALPKKIAADIGQELNILNKKNGTSKCQFFEVCRSNFNLINKVHTYPNPIVDEPLHIEFDLTIPMSIRIALHDMEGNEVRELQPYAEWQKGKNKTSFNLNLLPNGIYILALYNGSSYATQRILIQR
jgi:hypothetical protein